MKIYLTGAAGKLGSVTAMALHRAGHEVVGCDRQPVRNFPGAFHCLDLLDAPAVRATMAGCDAIVHLGNYPNVHAGPAPHVIYRENIAMNVHVFQAAAELGILRWIFASSIQVCSGHPGPSNANARVMIPYLPLDGDLPPMPLNLYALSKLAGEDLLRYFTRTTPSLSAAAIRFPMLLSEGSVRRLRAKYMPSSAIQPSTEAFTYLALDDAAELIRLWLERAPTGFHLLLPAARGNVLGWPAAEVIRRFYPDIPLKKTLEQVTSLVDMSDIERLCGWTPRLNNLFDGAQPMSPT